MVRSARIRLDELVALRGLAASRSAARGLILAGLVLVDGSVNDKAGAQVSIETSVALKARPSYVSRGGEKLARALAAFKVDVSGALALDVGASTGGFVDCLLQRGAARVIALDVGRGQLHSRLLGDPRVCTLDKINARNLTRDILPYVANLLTMDVSFISAAKVLPAVVACMNPSFTGIVLIKPQFEAGRSMVGKGGVIRDRMVHRHVLMELGRFVIGQLDAELYDICQSGLLGADGNVEFFFHLGRGGGKGAGLDTLEQLVDDVLVRG